MAPTSGRSDGMVESSQNAASQAVLPPNKPSQAIIQQHPSSLYTRTAYSAPPPASFTPDYFSQQLSYSLMAPATPQTPAYLSINSASAAAAPSLGYNNVGPLLLVPTQTPAAAYTPVYQPSTAQPTSFIIPSHAPLQTAFVAQPSSGLIAAPQASQVLLSQGQTPQILQQAYQSPTQAAYQSPIYQQPTFTYQPTPYMSSLQPEAVQPSSQAAQTITLQPALSFIQPVAQGAPSSVIINPSPAMQSTTEVVTNATLPQYTNSLSNALVVSCGANISNGTSAVSSAYSAPLILQYQNPSQAAVAAVSTQSSYSLPTISIVSSSAALVSTVSSLAGSISTTISPSLCPKQQTISSFAGAMQPLCSTPGVSDKTSCNSEDSTNCKELSLAQNVDQKYRACLLSESSIKELPSSNLSSISNISTISSSGTLSDSNLNVPEDSNILSKHIHPEDSSPISSSEAKSSSNCVALNELSAILPAAPSANNRPTDNQESFENYSTTVMSRIESLIINSSSNISCNKKQIPANPGLQNKENTLCDENKSPCNINEGLSNPHSESSSKEVHQGTVAHECLQENASLICDENASLICDENAAPENISLGTKKGMQLSNSPIAAAYLESEQFTYHQQLLEEFESVEKQRIIQENIKLSSATNTLSISSQEDKGLSLLQFEDIPEVDKNLPVKSSVDGSLEKHSSLPNNEGSKINSSVLKAQDTFASDAEQKHAVIDTNKAIIDDMSGGHGKEIAPFSTASLSACIDDHESLVGKFSECGSSSDKKSSYPQNINFHEEKNKGKNSGSAMSLESNEVHSAYFPCTNIDGVDSHASTLTENAAHDNLVKGKDCSKLSICQEPEKGNCSDAPLDRSDVQKITPNNKEKVDCDASINCKSGLLPEKCLQMSGKCESIQKFGSFDATSDSKSLGLVPSSGVVDTSSKNVIVSEKQSDPVNKTAFAKSLSKSCNIDNLEPEIINKQNNLGSSVCLAKTKQLLQSPERIVIKMKLRPSFSNREPGTSQAATPRSDSPLPQIESSSTGWTIDSNSASQDLKPLAMRSNCWKSEPVKPGELKVKLKCYDIKTEDKSTAERCPYDFMPDDTEGLFANVKANSPLKAQLPPSLQSKTMEGSECSSRAGSVSSEENLRRCSQSSESSDASSLGQSRRSSQSSEASFASTESSLSSANPAKGVHIVFKKLQDSEGYSCFRSRRKLPSINENPLLHEEKHDGKLNSCDGVAFNGNCVDLEAKERLSEADTSVTATSSRKEILNAVDTCIDYDNPVKNADETGHVHIKQTKEDTNNDLSLKETVGISDSFNSLESHNDRLKDLGMSSPMSLESVTPLPEAVESSPADYNELGSEDLDEGKLVIADCEYDSDQLSGKAKCLSNQGNNDIIKSDTSSNVMNREKLPLALLRLGSFTHVLELNTSTADDSNSFASSKCNSDCLNSNSIENFEKFKLHDCRLPVALSNNVENINTETIEATEENLEYSIAQGDNFEEPSSIVNAQYTKTNIMERPGYVEPKSSANNDTVAIRESETQIPKSTTDENTLLVGHEREMGHSAVEETPSGKCGTTSLKEKENEATGVSETSSETNCNKRLLDDAIPNPNKPKKPKVEEFPNNDLLSKSASQLQTEKEETIGVPVKRPTSECLQENISAKRMRREPVVALTKIDKTFLGVNSLENCNYASVDLAELDNSVEETCQGDYPSDSLEPNSRYRSLSSVKCSVSLFNIFCDWSISSQSCEGCHSSISAGGISIDVSKGLMEVNCSSCDWLLVKRVSANQVTLAS